MPRTLNLPKDQALWKLVERPTRDALTKIRLYQQALEVGTAPLDAQASVARYGYKALFANPWIATAGTLYSYKDLDGLAELVAAIQESPIIASKLGRSDPAAEDSSRQTNIHAHEVAMIPLVLADRYTARNRKAIDNDTLARLYLDQEAYLLGTDLRADIIVPILGAQLAKGYRFKEFSVTKATPETRSIFVKAQDISPMDAPDLGRFDYAMLIRNTPVDVVGHGYYFGAGPHEDGYNLIAKFFEGLNIVAPRGAWYAQLAVRPRGWAGFFENTRGSTFSFLFRDYITRVINRAHGHCIDIDNKRMIAAHRYGLALGNCHPNVRVAAERLMHACERSSDADTIVDLCIGIEAILGSGFGETVHKLCMRAAAMLTQAGWKDSQSLYNAMRDTYSYRSKIVHGVPGPHKQSVLRIDKVPYDASRFALAALSSLLELTLSTEGFDPNRIDEKFIFAALDVAGAQSR